MCYGKANSTEKKTRVKRKMAEMSATDPHCC